MVPVRDEDPAVAHRLADGVQRLGTVDPPDAVGDRPVVGHEHPVRDLPDVRRRPDGTLRIRVDAEDGRDLGGGRPVQPQASVDGALVGAFVGPDDPRGVGLQAHSGQEGTPGVLDAIDVEGLRPGEQAGTIGTLEHTVLTPGPDEIGDVLLWARRDLEVHRVVGRPRGKRGSILDADDVVRRRDQPVQVSRRGGVDQRTERVNRGHGGRLYQPCWRLPSTLWCSTI